MRKTRIQEIKYFLIQNILLLLIFIIGSIGIYSWFVGDFILVSIYKTYIAMAQSTSIAFCLISIHIFLYLNFNNSRFVKLFIRIFSIIIILYCSLLSYKYFFGLHIKLENFNIVKPKQIGNILYGRMSPVTAALFILVCVNILLLYIKNNISKLISDLITLILFIASFILLIGYLYQSPLLYASKIIPVALPTATCFLLLSLAFIRIIGLPFNIEGNKTIKYQLSRSFIPLVIAIVILQGFIETNILHRQDDPTIYVALLVFISIIISIILIVVNSYTVDKKLKESGILLHESEEQYRLLFKAIPIPTYTWKQAGDDLVLIDFNDKADTFTHGNVAKFLGIKASEMYKNEVQIIKDLKQCLQQKDIIEREMNFTLKSNDESKYLNVKYAFVHPDLVIVYTEDITERKQAEVELNIQKNFFEQMFMQSSVSTQILDKDGWCERINPKLGELFGVEPQYIEGKVYNIFKDDAIKQGGVIPYLERVFYEGKTVEWEVYFDIGVAAESQDIKVKEKKKEWFSNWAYPIFDEDGKVKHVIIQHNNITEQKKSEEAIRESESLLRSIAENTSDIIFAKDRECRFIFVNPACCELNNKTQEELIGHSKFEFHPDSIEGAKFQADDLRVMESGKMEVIEEDVSSMSGNIRTLLTTKAPRYDEQGNVIGLIGVAHDISNRKQAEQEVIKAKEKAEESDRLKSAFLANMSHEIRTPMNGIMGFADLLKEPQLTGEEQQRYINVIQKSGVRMLNIINDIISISKIEAGLMEVSLTDTNFNEQLDYIYTFFKPEAEAKGIKLTYTKYLPFKEALISTDREKVYSILTNLVKNAIKYTDEGFIDFGYVIKEGFIEFYIKDSGIGVPIDRQEAIFERFIQADIEDKRALQGAGLGLAITKAYVEMLGGKLWIESKVGEGSVFYFTLPFINKKEVNTNLGVDKKEDQVELNNLSSI